MAEETVVFARKASGLVREMSWWDVLLFTIAGPAAGGMTYYTVKMPGTYPGANMVLAFIIGFLVWLPPVLCIAAFASSFPRSGALYVVTSRVLHPMFGFIPNWIYVIGGGCGMAAGFIFYQGFIPIASTLQAAGEMSDSSALLSAGDWFSKPVNRLWIVLVFMVIVWALELMGLDKLKWVMRAIIYAPLVVTVIALVLFFVVDGKSAFDSVYGSGTVDAIKAPADAQGVQEAIAPTGKATTDVLLSVFWAYSALEVTSFVGSEVKTPRTSFLRGLLIGACAVGLLYTINAWAPGFSYGTDFIRDYSYLYYTSEESFNALQEAMGGNVPVQPVIPFFAGVNSGMGWLTIVMGLGYFFWFCNTSLLIWLAGVRGLFAMAFDRQLPLKLASVGKAGNPTWANHFLALFALVGVFMAYGDQLGTDLAIQFLAFMDIGALMFIWPMGLAAMFLPYLRPDLWEKSTFQYTWGGVPVITIIGAVTFGVGWWMVGIVGQYLNQRVILLTAGLLILGFVLVAWMYNRNRKEGIDPNAIFTQIPPS